MKWKNIAVLVIILTTLIVLQKTTAPDSRPSEPDSFSDSYHSVSFPEKTYMETVIALLTSINVYLGKPEYTQPKFKLDDAVMVKIITRLMADQYAPEEWFSVAKQPACAYKLKEDRPVLASQEDYRLLLFNSFIGEKAPSILSIGYGGILYEDPFYAVLGAFNLGCLKQPALLPRVKISDLAWVQRNEIIQLLKEKKYKPRNYFKLYTTRPPIGEPVRFCVIKGASLINFRGLGDGVVTLEYPKGSAFYSLYSHSSEFESSFPNLEVP